MRTSFRPTRGIIRDISSAMVPPEFLTEGRNVHFRNGGAEQTRGMTSVYSGITVEPWHLVNIPTDVNNNWIAAGVAGVEAIQVSTWADISPVGYTPPQSTDEVTSAVLNNVPVINVFRQEPVYWDRNLLNPMQPLPGWQGGTAYAVAAHKYHLFALGVDGYQERVRWSTSADPGSVPATWLPASDNDAGFVELSDTPGPLIDAITHRDGLFIAKNNSLYRAQYIGGNFIYQFRLVNNTWGVLSRNCMASCPAGLVLWADGDIVLVQDDGSARSIADKKVRKAIFDQINQDELGAAFVTLNKAANEIWFSIPTDNSPVPPITAVWDYISDAWSYRDHMEARHISYGIVQETGDSGQWDDDAQAWDLDPTFWQESQFSSTADTLLLGTDKPTPETIQVDKGDTLAGLEYTSRVERLGIQLDDDPVRVKLLTRVWPRAHGQGQVTVRAAASDNEEGPWNYSPPEVMDLAGTQGVPFDLMGRYFAVSFEGPGTGQWRLDGWDMDWQMAGEF